MFTVGFILATIFVTSFSLYNIYKHMNKFSSFFPKDYICITNNITISTSLKQLSSLLSLINHKSFLFRPAHMATVTTASSAVHHRRQKPKKLVVIMGPTGSGKSKLSVDLATRFFPNSEIINSDKIQVYRGLDIATNKISMHDRRGVPHHFLGEFNPDIEFTASEFRSLGHKTIAQITSRRNLPFVVGGSNSFIYSLLAKRFDPEGDVFNDSGSANSVVCSELRYNCCFLWVDVSLPVLNQYLEERVDEMLESGMFEELAEYFAVEGYSESDSVSQTGLRKAIGLPEFESYFKRVGSRWRGAESEAGADVERKHLYEEAVKAIKDNTCKLAEKQLRKIQRLRDAGWDLHKIDATEAFRAAMTMTSDSGERASENWEKLVVEPSVKIVKQFLME